MILMDFEGLFDPERMHRENDNHDLVNTLLFQLSRFGAIHVFNHCNCIVTDHFVVKFGILNLITQ